MNLKKSCKQEEKKITFLFFLICNYPRLRLFEFKTFFFCYKNCSTLLATVKNLIDGLMKTQVRAWYKLIWNEISYVDIHPIHLGEYEHHCFGLVILLIENIIGSTTKRAYN